MQAKTPQGSHIFERISINIDKYLLQQMNKDYVQKTIYPLLLVLAFLTSCNGQTQTQPPTETPSPTENQRVTKTTHIGQPKLINTQGTQANNNVHCGLQDKAGNLWFGTTGSGVYRYDGKLFYNYTTKDGLISDNVWSILEDKSGNIWFGTTEGICRYDGKNISSVPIPFFVRPVIYDNAYYTKWSTKNTVWSMLQDKTGIIWFGTGDGVYRYDGISFSCLLANYGIINNDSLHLKVVADIVEDKNGIIWFFSGILPGDEGICRFDGKKIERIKPMKYGWNRNALESSSGNLLVATRHYGIWASNGNSFTAYAQPKDLINMSLNYILEDKVGNLWIASDYGKDSGDTLGGLWHSSISSSNPTGKTFTKIFNKAVYFVLEDKDSNIWFSTTSMGLYRYNRKTLTKFSE
jgi:ligand-binding sensor domain-containing protein